MPPRHGMLHTGAGSEASRQQVSRMRSSAKQTVKRAQQGGGGVEQREQLAIGQDYCKAKGKLGDRQRERERDSTTRRQGTGIISELKVAHDVSQIFNILCLRSTKAKVS